MTHGQRIIGRLERFVEEQLAKGIPNVKPNLAIRLFRRLRGLRTCRCGGIMIPGDTGGGCLACLRRAQQAVLEEVFQKERDARAKGQPA